MNHLKESIRLHSQLDHSPTVTRTNTLAAFQEAVNSSFVPLHISSVRPENFMSTLASTGAAGVAFTEVSSGAQLVERTTENIQAGGSGYYKFSLLLSGSSILIQDGKEVVMRPGDISFYDTSRPYSLLFEQPFRNLIMMFKKERVEAPQISTDSLTAICLNQENDIANMIAPFIAQAAPKLSTLPALSRFKLANSSLELMNTLLSTILDSKSPTQDPHEVLLQQIYAYIHANLGSVALSPQLIADTHYISTRHLHALFASQEMSVSTLIRSRRLERCHADLADPFLADQTVASIAYKWGFTDPAHFSRVFKRAIGISPSDARHH